MSMQDASLEPNFKGDGACYRQGITLDGVVYIAVPLIYH